MNYKKVKKNNTLQKINIQPLSDSESKKLKGGNTDVIVIDDHIA